MEDVSVGTRRDPEGFPPSFAAIAPHPGPLAPLGLGPNGHGGEIDIDPQEVLGKAMVGRGSIALEVIPRHALKLGDVLSPAGPQRACDRRLVGTARAAKSALHGGVCTNRHVTLGDGFGATKDPDHGIEDLVHGTIPDRLLGNLDLLAERGKETSAPQILAEGTEARTPCVKDGRLRHGALLAGRGYGLS